MRGFILALTVLAISTVEGTSYENNKTNVGVYANHISSCNLDHKFGDMLCINRDYESVIQYHDVKAAVFCPYHYCVTFRTEENKLACTGYSYLKMSGSMSEYINPLSPNNSALEFSGEGDAENVKVGVMFEGYNVLIDYFRQSIETYFGGQDSGQVIVDVKCDDGDGSKLVTCVYFSNGKSECFGAKDVVFYDFITSLVLGVVVPGSLSFACYIILWVLGNKYSCAKNGCITVLLTPIIVEVCCLLILFVAADFIVKVFPFLIASLVGIWIGKGLTDMLTGCFSVWSGKLTGRVENDYGSGERTGMLRNSNKDGATKANQQFVIGEEDDSDEVEGGMTEIELGSVRGDEDDERPKRI